MTEHTCTHRDGYEHTHAGLCPYDDRIRIELARQRRNLIGTGWLCALLGACLTQWVNYLAP